MGGIARPYILGELANGLGNAIANPDIDALQELAERLVRASPRKATVPPKDQRHQHRKEYQQDPHPLPGRK